jgi:hypothetical protein
MAENRCATGCKPEKDGTFNQGVIQEFRATAGRISGGWEE